MRISKRLLFIAPALALLSAFLLLPPPTAGAQEQRLVDLELSIYNRHQDVSCCGLFVVSVGNNSDVTVRGIRVQLEVEDVALGRSIFLDEATSHHWDNDGIVDYDTLEWTIPSLRNGGTATTVLTIDGARSELTETEWSVVRLQGSIVESTPRELPAASGNNQARHYLRDRVGLRESTLFPDSVAYGVDADSGTDTFTVKVANRNRGIGGQSGHSPFQYQLRVKVTPSQGLRYTATAPAGTTFDAATGIWDIGTLERYFQRGGNMPPSGYRQLDIRVTGRDARAGPPEEQCLTVEIEHKIPDAPAFWLPVTACMAHQALITGGPVDIFNWHDCVSDSDYPCGSQPSLELTAVKSANETRGGPQVVQDVHRGRFRTDHINSEANDMILQPEGAALQVPDWPLNRKIRSGNTEWSTIDHFDLYLGHQNLQDAGGWTDLMLSGTVTAPGGGPAPGSWSLRTQNDFLTFLEAADDTKVSSITYQLNQLGNNFQFPVKIDFGALGTYVALFEIKGTKAGTTYTDSGAYTFHVGPVAELAVRELRTDEPAPGVEPGQTALTVVAVNNGPDQALGAKVDVTLPAGVTVASHIASDGTYDEDSGTWDLGAFQHRDYRTTNGLRPEATLTLILDCPTDGCGEATARIYNDNDNHPYRVVIDGATHTGTVYDYIDANNTAMLTARAGTGEPLPDAPIPMESSTAAVVQWSPVAEVNGWPVSHYEVQRSANTWETVAEVTGTAYADTDVTPGEKYTYRVRAVNVQGAPGSWSQPMEATALFPAGVQVPGIPVDLTLAAGDGQLTASWGEPEHLGNPRLNGYSVQYREQGAELWTEVTHSGAGRSATITGLDNGTIYQVRVAAMNASGTGDYVEASATPVRGAAVPGAPTDLAVTVGHGQMTLSWSAPEELGNPEMDGYQVQYRASGNWQTWTRTATDPLSTMEVITGLDNGRTYQVRVAAVNTVGVSLYATASGRPVADASIPGPPTDLALAAGDRRLTASWSEPEHVGNPRLNVYLVEYSADGGTSWTDAEHRGTGRTQTITGLDNGTEYQVRVAAVNTVGVSGYAEASDTPKGDPTAVQCPPDEAIAHLPDPYNECSTAPHLMPEDMQVLVVWGEPADDGGADITGYLVQYRASGSWQTWHDNGQEYHTALGTLISDLTNGRRYQVRVRAVNADGAMGPWAQGSAVPNIPPRVPSEPPNVVPTGGDGQIEVTWREPYDVGHPALSGYRVQYRVDGSTDWLPARPISARSTATSATITGLTNGTTYQVQVWAVNSAGASPKAGADGALRATPEAEEPDPPPDGPEKDEPETGSAPTAPTNLALTPGDGEIQVSWDAPEDLGQPEIEDYTLEHRAAGEDFWNSRKVTATSATITGLTNGTEYEVRVLASNEHGDAIAGPQRATPQEPPDTGTAPQNLMHTQETYEDVDGSPLKVIVMSWDHPDSDSFPDVTGYKVQFRRGASGDWLDRRCTVADNQTIEETCSDHQGNRVRIASIIGVSSGTYQVRVAAVNREETGAWATLTVPVR